VERSALISVNPEKKDGAGNNEKAFDNVEGFF